MLAPDVARAHNTLVSTDPIDGAVLDGAPLFITWVFENPVPLDSMTVTLIAASGERTELSDFSHGPEGETVVVTPLPDLADGSVTARWRLVGSDGHPITGRIAFEVSPPSAPDAGVAGDAIEPGSGISVGAGAVDPQIIDDLTDDYSTPGPLRWVLRYGSYLAIFAVVGILGIGSGVWPAVAEVRGVRSVFVGALVAIVVFALAQLAVLASDLTGAAPWSSLGELGSTSVSTAGVALMVRIVLVGVVALVVFSMDVVNVEVRRAAILCSGMALLGTWAFAGHAASMRWSTAGVLADVVHHGAAAIWVSGLVIVSAVAIPAVSDEDRVEIVRRFSGVAAVCVSLLVVTGSLQAVRLVGHPMRLIDTGHGRLLVAKLVVVAAMLAIAGVNRSRVHRASPARRSADTGQLRRAMLVEFTIGFAVLAITAALVVSPPGTAGEDDRTPTDQSSNVYDIM
ncbi:MAG: CopD family protein [Actinomycetota bacterium]|nr:CopD family protein [Actinomycetota bacterium]